jgi:hypothetical protein
VILKVYWFYNFSFSIRDQTQHGFNALTVYLWNLFGIKSERRVMG